VQYGRCKPYESSQRSRRIEVADDGRHAFGAQLVGARGTRRERDDARGRRASEQAARAAQPDIAASDDEHAGPAQDSCSVHVRAL
jgi:hypothetical protein